MKPVGAPPDRWEVAAVAARIETMRRPIDGWGPDFNLLCPIRNG